jgi:hypothetical protein
MPLVPQQSELPRLLQHPLSFARSYWLPLAILLAGTVADCVTTYHNLALYGPGAETHIVQRWVSELVGVHAGVPLAKFIQFCFVVGVAAWWRRWTPWLLILCGLLYAAAAISNYYLLL